MRINTLAFIRLINSIRFQSPSLFTTEMGLESSSAEAPISLTESLDTGMLSSICMSYRDHDFHYNRDY